MRHTNVWRLTVCAATAFTMGLILPAGAARVAEDGPAKDQAAPEAKDKAPAKAAKEPKVLTEFPKSLKDYRGRLLGTISAVDKKGIVLSKITIVEREFPFGGGMTMTKAVEKNDPAAWLAKKNVRLVWKDPKFMKNYKPGQVIFASVEWSEKDKALQILGAQWSGLRR